MFSLGGYTPTNGFSVLQVLAKFADVWLSIACLAHLPLADKDRATLVRHFVIANFSYPELILLLAPRDQEVATQLDGPVGDDSSYDALRELDATAIVVDLRWALLLQQLRVSASTARALRSCSVDDFDVAIEALAELEYFLASRDEPVLKIQGLRSLEHDITLWSLFKTITRGSHDLPI